MDLLVTSPCRVMAVEPVCRALRMLRESWIARMPRLSLVPGVLLINRVSSTQPHHNRVVHLSYKKLRATLPVNLVGVQVDTYYTTAVILQTQATTQNSNPQHAQGCAGKAATTTTTDSTTTYRDTYRDTASFETSPRCTAVLYHQTNEQHHTAQSLPRL